MKHFFQYAQQINRLRNKNGGKKHSLVLLGPGENADEPEESPKKKRNYGVNSIKWQGKKPSQQVRRKLIAVSKECSFSEREKIFDSVRPELSWEFWYSLHL